MFLVTAASGTQTCQTRYVDNGDGTVTDNQAGLMWEKKSAAGTGDGVYFNSGFVGANDLRFSISARAVRTVR